MICPECGPFILGFLIAAVILTGAVVFFASMKPR
jgi:hypothetical protein